MKRTLRLLAVVQVEILDPAWSIEEVERDIPDHLHDAVTILQSQMRRKQGGDLPFAVTSVDTILYASVQRGEEI